MLHDPIADLLTRIRNAQMQRHKYVDVPLSKGKFRITQVLEAQGFVGSVLVNKEERVIRIMLKYGANRTPILNGLKRVSKPGSRKYIGCQEIPKVLGGMGIAILSTSQGVLDGESAREKRLGGELLCCIW